MKLSSTLIMAALAVPGAALAQTAPDGSGQEAVTVDDVVVTGTRASLAGALTVKREADGFVDAIVASDIAQFPDLNLAEALQRVPGVTITRNQGEGDQIILRGFTPDFTRVEINGMSATPTSLGREFSFSIFASELFSRAEVRKTGSADQVEGGLAGTVQLYTPKPLDRPEGVTFAASASSSYAELSKAYDPRFALVAGRNWGDRFGAVATIAYSDQSFLAQWADVSNWDQLRDSLTAAARNGVPAATLDSWLPRAPRLLHFERSRERVGASLDLQYRPYDGGLLTLSALYGQTERSGLELRTDLAELESGVVRPANVITDNVIDGRGRIISGTFGDAEARAYTTENSNDETFTQVVLRGEFELGDAWSLDVLAGATQSTGVFFDRAYSFGRVGDGVLTVNGDFANFSIPGVSSTDPRAFTNFRYADFRNRTKHDDEYAAQFDLSRQISLGLVSAVSFGTRYADHTQSVEEDKWGGLNASDPVFLASARGPNGLAVGLSGAPANAVTLVPFHVSGQPGGYPTSIMRLDFDVLNAFYGLNAMKTARQPLASFEVTEEITAAYARADVDTTIGGFAVKGQFGVRWVDTALTSIGARTINNVITPIEVERSYDELLPSASFRVELTDDVFLRTAFGRTLNRPKLEDLSPRATLDVGRNTGSSGNPELDPFTATYFDVGLEWYFGPEALIAATYFRKDIDSLVETLTEDVTLTVPPTTGGAPVPTLFQLIRPINGEDARVQGVEFIIQTPFSFLPAPLGGFGGLFNYTFTDSEANFRDATNVSSVQLPGLSKNSFNAVLYHQTDRTDVRLTYAWRDALVDNPFGPGGNPIWQDAFGQFDLSGTFKLSDRLAIKFEALNLTKKGERLYTAGREDLAVRRADNERRFGFGLRYTY